MTDETPDSRAQTAERPSDSTTGERTVSEESWTIWSVRNCETGDIMFTTRLGVDVAEDWVSGLATTDIELIRTECHSRHETWQSEPEIIPEEMTDVETRRFINESALRQRFINEQGAVSIAALTSPTATVRNWERAHKIVVLSHQDLKLIPAFMLTNEMAPEPMVGAALQKLYARGFSDWAQALWWIIPNEDLDDDRPVDVLSSARNGTQEHQNSVRDLLAKAAVPEMNFF